ncbi:transcriptional regulator [Hylemonella gracilis str. Niagara R]|uniref:Transcriptional regulator n=1 Tax=Hylemonella gracilis str. Niagara R TaxID=1458275 RepID=A0A016XLQ6_9BURK|nr:TetR/AcrR family transcriptional regulator [Hylemonella gracilis]EYC52502.1 transcriptional regulator [Hylemonella gracilis str. Niagara R]
MSTRRPSPPRKAAPRARSSSPSGTTSRTPARRDPERTRARLLEAAVEEFASHGYSGARTDRIVQAAGTSIRMLYHYFGDKDGLYLEVLDTVMAELRQAELQAIPDDLPPMEGLLRAFDFIAEHFADHPKLRKLLAFENLNEARHLSLSERIPKMAVPVVSRIRQLLARGAATGEVRADIDALQLYIAMAGLAYYGRQHAHTLSHILKRDLHKPGWQKANLQTCRAMVEAYLKPPG